MKMVSAIVLGVVCGITGMIVAIVVVIVCRTYRKRKHRTCLSPCGYDAVGDYKPPSLMSVSTSSQVKLKSHHPRCQYLQAPMQG